VVLAVVVWVVVFCTPNAGAAHGHSFFSVAANSGWRNFCEWAAAWCSLKIILLNVGALILILAAMLLLELGNRERFSHWLIYLMLLPILGSWVGGFYLLKALL
jgi:hypothetical protein